MRELMLFCHAYLIIEFYLLMKDYKVLLVYFTKNDYIQIS